MPMLRLKEYRLAKGWSRRQLAEQLDNPVNTRTIVRWEKDPIMPRPWNLENLARIFDISLSELFNNEKDA